MIRCTLECRCSGHATPVAVGVASASTVEAGSAAVDPGAAAGCSTEGSTILSRGSGERRRRGRWAAVRPHLQGAGPRVGERRVLHTTRTVLRSCLLLLERVLGALSLAAPALAASTAIAIALAALLASRMSARLGARMR